MQKKWNEVFKPLSRGGNEVLFAEFDPLFNRWVSVQKKSNGAVFSFDHDEESDTSHYDLMPIEPTVVNAWAIIGKTGDIEILCKVNPNCLANQEVLMGKTVVKLTGEYVKA